RLLPREERGPRRHLAQRVAARLVLALAAPQDDVRAGGALHVKPVILRTRQTVRQVVVSFVRLANQDLPASVRRLVAQRLELRRPLGAARGAGTQRGTRRLGGRERAARHGAVGQVGRALARLHALELGARLDQLVDQEDAPRRNRLERALELLRAA